MRQLVLTLSLAAAVVGCASPTSTAPPPNETTTDSVRRLGAILDYVAADYGGAVVNGAVASADEYAEQLAFLDDASALLSRMPPRDVPGGGTARLEELRRSVQAHEQADRVAATARTLRHDVMGAYGVVVAPSAAPSYERGASLYGEKCTTCHGATGGGDGAAAASLRPPPRSFLDATTMDGMSPVRVFNALTDGVSGTAMQSFGDLSAGDRWSLAFFVLSLRHPAAIAASGESSFRRAGLAGNASALADMTDADLLTRAQATLSDANAAHAALAFARREAVYHQSGAPFDVARTSLAAANAAYHAGKSDEARQLVSSSYLDGVEPHEASLAAVDADLVHRLEAEFLSLRQSIADRAPPGRVEQQALRIGALLDQADRRLNGSRGTRVAIISAAVIVVREGFEAALLILLLFAIARRSGATPKEMRSIHVGWVAALGVGVIVWFASGALLRLLGGARRELLEGGISLFAALVLLGVSHFVLARRDAQRRIAALKARLGQASSSPKRRQMVLASLSFVAVFREGFEVVLFLRAVMLDSAASSWTIGVGVAIGVVAVAGLAVIAARIGQRLKPGILLTATGTLLCGLAIMLAGKGVRALQEAGTLSITPIRAPTVEWLGMFATRQTFVAQALALLAFAAIAGWQSLRNRTHSALRPTADSPKS